MKKVLFLSLGVYPTAQTRTATEVRAVQNLTALQTLGCDLTVITTPDPLNRPPLYGRTVLAPPLPGENFVEFQKHRHYLRQVRNLVRQTLGGAEDVLFCEHWAALACSPRHERLIYSMHDFEAKLIPARRLRKGQRVTWRTRLYWHYARWLEDQLAHKSAAIIAVSASEAREALARWRRPATYIPIVSFEPEKPQGEFSAARLRFWLYGSSGATSNKIILDHLHDILFSRLKASMPQAEFHQVGSCQRYDADKLAWLKENFTVHGFVDQVGGLFRPGDFCLIPYAFDTGFRTKIPEMCGYGIIPVGYPITFACCPEMRDDVNCVAAETPTTLAAKLAQIATDPARRQRLSDGALATRRQELSFAAQLERYRQALNFTQAAS